MSGVYDIKLRAATYRDDVVCEIRLHRHPKDESREPLVAWMSERLLQRLRHLALAYDLSLLGRLPGSGSITYPEIQLDAIEDELAFLFGVVSDEALLEAVSPIRELIRKAQHECRGCSLSVETT